MQSNAIFILIIVALSITSSMQDRVSTTEACKEAAQKTYYEKGCSGLTAKLLGDKKWKRVFTDFIYLLCISLLSNQANLYRLGEYVGTNYQYSGLVPGDLVGWHAKPWGHVAVYIGKEGCDCMFVEVNGPKANARCLKQGWGNKKVYKVDY